MLWPEPQLQELITSALERGSVDVALGSPREAHLCRQALYRLIERKVLLRMIVSVNENIVTIAKPILPSITLIQKDNAA